MKYVLVTLVVLCLASCAATELKAPCDYQGSFCGQKMKINQ